MEDPRNQSYITYTQADLGYMAILKNVCGQYSMRETEENFNKDNCIDTLRIMSGRQRLDKMPHYDTLNDYLEKLSPDCPADIRKKMVTSLIRGKQFGRGRLLGKYWRVILDGTGLFYFKEKHCGNCLCTTKKTEEGKTVKMYYHKVLEAKIVLSAGIPIICQITNSQLFTFIFRIYCVPRTEVQGNNYSHPPHRHLFFVIFTKLIESEKRCKVRKFKDF